MRQAWPISLTATALVSRRNSQARSVSEAFSAGAHRMAGFRVLASQTVSQPGRVTKPPGYSPHPPFKKNPLREIRDFESDRRPEGKVALS